MGGTEYKTYVLKRRTSKKRKGFCKKKGVGEAEEEIPVTEAVGIEENPVDFEAVPMEENPVVIEAAPGPSNAPDQPVSADTSSSSKKLRDSIDASLLTPFDYGQECTVLVNMDIILSTFKKVAVCPECLSYLQVSHNLEKKAGLAHFIDFCCPECHWEEEMCTSYKIKSKVGKSSYEINRNAVVTFRELGLGYSNLQNFCGLMSIPPPMTKIVYQRSLKEIEDVYVEVAKELMHQATVETRKDSLKEAYEPDKVVDVIASFDGMWQKRGHISLNGVVTAMSLAGKCIDYEIKSKVCKSCQYWKSKQGTEEYEKWKETHICQINHDGSAGKMETVAIKDIFQHSVKNNSLRYTTYLGDGDSKSYAQVAELKPYGDKKIDKAECVGHIQKRLGTRLRDLKLKYRGKRLPDGKTIGGVGRLNEKTINTLQNYYGVAIRNNNELYAMKKSVAAILHHCSDNSSLDERHKYCPRASDSWCRYQSDKITGKTTYKTKINIPKAVYDVLKPIFSHEDLGSDELLKQCLHGRTQNPNESINNVIWARCPKRVYVGMRTMQIGVASAVISFNDGALGLLPVFDKLKIRRGNCRMKYLQKRDILRVKIMNKKCSIKGKARRTKLRSIRKRYVVADEATEGELYAKGRFHS